MKKSHYLYLLLYSLWSFKTLSLTAGSPSTILDTSCAEVSPDAIENMLSWSHRCGYISERYLSFALEKEDGYLRIYKYYPVFFNSNQTLHLAPSQSSASCHPNWLEGDMNVALCKIERSDYGACDQKRLKALELGEITLDEMKLLKATQKAPLFDLFDRVDSYEICQDET